MGLPLAPLLGKGEVLVQGQRETRRQRYCVFCGTFGKVTKEHIWPVWMQSVLPLDLKARNVHHTTGTGRLLTRVRSGDVGSRRLAIACGGCNGGWMSALQCAAQPHLTKLIQGQTDIAPEAFPIIAAWCVMFSMAWDQADRLTIAVSEADRRNLRGPGSIPAGWSVWIGRYPARKGDGPEQGHRALKNPSVPEHDPDHRGALTIAKAGQLVFVCMPRLWNMRPLPTFWSDERLQEIYPNMGAGLHAEPTDGNLRGIMDRLTAAVFAH